MYRDATAVVPTISVMNFWIIEIVILVLCMFIGFAINRWMKFYDPSKNMMFIGGGALVGVLIGLGVYYFIKDKVKWNQ